MTTKKIRQFRIVVDSIKDCSNVFHELPLVESSEYLSPEYSDPKSVKIFNLCSHRRRLSTGYYVSLLAEARGQRCLPEATTLHHLSRNVLARDAIDSLQPVIDHSFKSLTSSRFTLSVYFGKNLAEKHTPLSKKLYSLFPSPLVRYEFKKDAHWRLTNVHHVGLSQIPEEHLEFVKDQLDRFIERPWINRPSPAKTYSYDLAILVNPEEPTPPSDAGALKKFVSAAEELGMRAEIINPRDFPRLLEFDALFIRETTRLDNHTYRFASKAARVGMPVIDDPESIRRCCNKVFLSELMLRQQIPTPQSKLLSRNNIQSLSQEFNYPIILKIPDGSFSLGVYKVKSSEELITLCKELFATSSILLAQEFLPTDFDWRIGVVSGSVLYACRYFMSKNHWQIYNHKAKGSDKAGDSDCVPLDSVPKVVLDTALQASSLMGDGFYGVDIKHIDGKALVIEVNDNPSVDAGVEDELIGDELYLSIMRHLLNKLDENRQNASKSEATAAV